MPQSIRPLWTDISEKTPLDQTIRLLNRRLTNLGKLEGLEAVCEIVLGGPGSTITTGIQGDVNFPDFSALITGWTLTSTVAGSIQIDLWRAAYAQFPPTVAQTITAAKKPKLVAVAKNQASEVPTWVQQIRKGDTLRVNVDSVTTCTNVTLALSLIKTG